MVLAATVFTTQDAGAQSQIWSFDWSKKPAEGSSVSAPKIELSSAETITLQILNVNQIQYRYNMACTGTATESPIDLFSQLIRGSGEAGGTDCTKAVGTLRADLNDFREPPKDATTGKPPSNDIALARKQVDAFLQRIAKVQQQCKQDVGQIEALEKTAAELRVLRSVGDTITFTQSIAPDYEYTCTVTEQTHNGIATEKGTLQIAINPGNSIVTLSVGVLGSTVPTRSFEVVAAPNDQNMATNVLGVQGDSISGNIATLINVRAPWKKLQKDNWGVDFTIVQTGRIGNSADRTDG